MKTFTLAIVAGLSIVVSVMLLTSMPNVDEPAQQEKPKDVQIDSSTPEKLFTIKDWNTHPNSYTYEEAQSIVIRQFIKYNQECDDRYGDDLTLQVECYTKVNYWRIEVDDIMRRAYQ